jgi:RimJ/RimL family protein N-acetyltransferase
MNPKFTLSKMTEEDARSILSWRYDAPYDFYDAKDGDLEKDVETLVEPTNFYVGVRDRDDDLVAYYCFGGRAQVPGGDYTENAVDIGGGARPDMLGTGFGEMFVRVAMDFGQILFSAEKYRATIAGFNTRALRMCEKAGFIRSNEFIGQDGTEFVVLIRLVDREDEKK